MPPDALLPDPLAETARLQPDALAVVAPGQTLRYDEFEQHVAATARRLAAHGLGDGARIALYLPHGLPLLTLLLATIRAGGVACPLSTRLPAAGVAARLQTLAADALITANETLVRELEAVWTIHAPDVFLHSEGEREPAAARPASTPATVVFTSGSTGTPKAALHSLGNHVFNARGSNENIALAPGNRWLLALPLYHVGGLGIVFRCLLAGATLALPRRGEAPPEAIARLGITHVSLVATQLRRLLQTPAQAAPLQAMLLGGSAIPPGLLAAAHARAWPIFTTYGLTEMASQVTTTPPGATLAQLRTSGRLLLFRAMRLSEEGEILVRGATRFLGYLDGATLHTPFDAEGWFRTGDLGRLDDAGLLHVHGRTDNLFISGGENIQPEEIEQALCSLDGVAQAVVVPIADEEFGQRPVAFVTREAGAPALDALAGRLAPLLPRFMIPRAFYDFPAEIPAGMKLDRAFFRRLALQRQKEES